MGQFIDQIIIASKRGRGFAEGSLKGVTPAIFARKPRFETKNGTHIVDCNHGAFIFGHLALYPTRIASLVGIDGADLAAPAHYTDLFKAGVDCKDDPEGTIYPKMDEITQTFFRNYDGLYERLANVDDSVLLKPTPDERYQKNFPTVGTAVPFMLLSHVMMHMGQMSTWRRCYGLASIM